MQQYQAEELPHNSTALQEREYLRVFGSLEKGELVPSHWHLYITYHGDTGGDQWNEVRLRQCLDAVLNQVRLQKCLDILPDNENVNVSTIWAADAVHTLGDIDHHNLRTERGGTLSVDRASTYLSGASRINLSDFIWSCCKHQDIIFSPLVLGVMVVVLYPFYDAVNGQIDDWMKKTHNHLKNIHRVSVLHTKQ